MDVNTASMTKALRMIASSMSVALVKRFRNESLSPGPVVSRHQLRKTGGDNGDDAHIMRGSISKSSRKSAAAASCVPLGFSGGRRRSLRLLQGRQAEGSSTLLTKFT